jgi:DNA polymerase I
LSLRVLVLDVETTTSNKGQPFDQTNKLVCIAAYTDKLKNCYDTSDDSREYVQALVEEADVIVGFNFKFDYHWLRKWGIKLDHKRIWDCQLAEFIYCNQIGALPSLDRCLEKYGLEKKIDVVKLEYWAKGIDTDQIPWDVLSAYAIQDVKQTYELYLIQQTLLSQAKKKLLSLMCQDLHILQEMEWNGLVYDSALCEERATELSKKIETINGELAGIYPDVPINFGSSQQLSAFLYGGTIKQEVKEHVGFFKTGKQVGQPKYANRVIEHQLPRMYTPLKNSEMAKEGIFSTDEGTLKKLKGKKKVVDQLLMLSKMSKLNETYYIGLPKLNAKMNWEPNMLHGQFNQCIAVTGRLSSSAPNLQNFASDLQDIFITRF